MFLCTYINTSHYRERAKDDDEVEDVRGYNNTARALICRAFTAIQLTEHGYSEYWSIWDHASGKKTNVVLFAHQQRGERKGDASEYS